MQPTYTYDEQRHWLVDMVIRWLTGWIQPDEVFMLYLIGFTLQIATRWMHQNEPQLSMVGRRIGFTVFFLLVGWYLNCDRGLQNVDTRIFHSIALAWVAAGLSAVLAYPIRAIFLVLTAHARSVGERANTARQRRLHTIHQAETERIRAEQEAVRQLEETRAHAARDRHTRRMDVLRLKDERVRRETEEQEALAHEANRQRLAPYRLEVDLAYTRKRVAIEPVMNEARYQKYFVNFLTDDLSTEEYRRRSGALIKLINDLSEIVPQARRRRDPMAEVIEKFQQKKADLQELDIDEDTLEVLESVIDEALENALQEFLR